MKLNLRELETSRHHFLTSAAGINFGHAASVCFESQGHPIKINMPDEGYYKKTYLVTRRSVTAKMKRAWNDDEIATQEGAYGIAILIASKEIKVKAIEKSKKKTGIDYWLGTKAGSLFQNKIRLEVSGIRKGRDYLVNKRLKDKSKQSKKSDHYKIPALIIIVEFDRPRVKTKFRNIK